MTDNTKRFSNRVEHYTKYRPSYPAPMIEYLFESTKTPEAPVIADIGSGTGIFTGLLLDRAKRVYAVEPNSEMRAHADACFAHHPAYASIDGTAERTGLPDSGVDAVTVAQAFHWFDRSACGKEFARVLRPRGRVFIIWNIRRTDSPFQKEYERILTLRVPEYGRVGHRSVTPDILETFLPYDFGVRIFPNTQHFDWDGVLGRFASSSYAPLPGTDAYAAVERELKAAFDAFAEDGSVEFSYETKLYSGRFEP